MIEEWIVINVVGFLGPTIFWGLVLVGCVVGIVAPFGALYWWDSFLHRVQRPLWGWVEPYPGDAYITDGRHVTVRKCNEKGVTLEVGGSTITVSHRYFHRRSRRAEDVPPAIHEMRGQV